MQANAIREHDGRIQEEREQWRKSWLKRNKKINTFKTKYEDLSRKRKNSRDLKKEKQTSFASYTGFKDNSSTPKSI